MTRAAIDLFAGAGGATQGLKDAGYDVVAAVENDRYAAESFALNHRGVLLAQTDIREVDAYRLRQAVGLERGALSLLKACPPCQGFSSLGRGEVDEGRNDLVLDIFRFVQEFRPSALLLENVPGLGADGRLTTLLACLEDIGYANRRYKVDAQDFGVPQRRRRLIVIAVRRDLGPSMPDDLIEALPVEFDASPTSAGLALEVLARFRRAATVVDEIDRGRESGAVVAARIAAIPVGGTRFDLPEAHRLPCHGRLGKSGGSTRVATASYGRVRADLPAPTMTTRCTTPACGSFVHPTLNRGLTLREAATLQTFPLTYAFAGGYDAIERQIGNAVPVRLAEALGLVVGDLLTHAEAQSIR